MLSAQGKMVYCWKINSKDDLTYIYIYRPEFYLRIRKNYVDTLSTNKHFHIFKLTQDTHEIEAPIHVNQSDSLSSTTILYQNRHMNFLMFPMFYDGNWRFKDKSKLHLGFKYFYILTRLLPLVYWVSTLVCIFGQLPLPQLKSLNSWLYVSSWPLYVHVSEEGSARHSSQPCK